MTVSVIVPAHNEAAVLPRLLRALHGADLEVIVVCNGCTDDTAKVARRWPGVRVEEITEASKAAALRRGDEVAGFGTRAYVDADVVISGRDVGRLAAAVEAGEALAVGPERRFDQTGVGWPVRAYYRVWQALPAVREGLFGRGVLVVGPAGRARVAGLPPMMSDDLVLSEAFGAAERRVVPGTRVTIWPPKQVADLRRRRARVVVGNAQADRAGVRSAAARTTPATLAGVVRRDRRLIGPMAVFLALTVDARWRARRQVRRGDFTTWLRDESSRAA